MKEGRVKEAVQKLKSIYQFMKEIDKLGAFSLLGKIDT